MSDSTRTAATEKTQGNFYGAGLAILALAALLTTAVAGSTLAASSDPASDEAKPADVLALNDLLQMGRN